MLIDPRCIPEVLEKLKPDEFYVKLNRDIYETMYAMFSYGQTIDPVTVLDQMKVRGVIRRITARTSPRSCASRRRRQTSWSMPR